MGDKLLSLFQSQEAAVDAEVIAFAVAPLFACIVIVIRSSFLLVVGDKLAGGGTVNAFALAHRLDAIVDVGGDEYVDYVLVVTQYVVGGSAYEYAVALIGSLLDGVTLKFIETFLDRKSVV